MQKIENLRKKIVKLKSIIASQNEYLKSQATTHEEDFYYYENTKKELTENEQKLSKLHENFSNAVKEVEQNKYSELIKWKNLHEETITVIKNFIKSEYFEGRAYTEKRTKIISEVYTSWNNFIDTKQIPDTYLLPDYEIFYEILQYKNKLKDKNIPIKKIEEIENLRQKIAILSKKQSYNNTILEKGSAWGATIEDMNKAEKDYKTLASKISKTAKKLKILIKKLELTDTETVNKWILLHFLTCVSVIIIAFTKSASTIQKDTTTLFVADKTFYLWKNMFKENKKYIIPNSYYLGNYDNIFNKILHSNFMTHL